MSRTDKDHREHSYSICRNPECGRPSDDKKRRRRLLRERAAQDLRNGREPKPKYPDSDAYYYW